MTSELVWVDAPITELSALQVHHLLKLRMDVFVVEQQCIYPELDGLDALPSTRHLFASHASDGVIAAARILGEDSMALENTMAGDKSQQSPTVRIGRVVVAKPYRGKGVAQQLMSRVIACCQTHFPSATLELSAQVGVEALYASYGFKVVSDTYLEDGIAHRDMQLKD